MKILITLIIISLSIILQGEEKNRSVTYKGTFIKTYRVEYISAPLMDVKLTNGKIITFTVFKDKHLKAIKQLKKHQKLTLFRINPDTCDCRCFDEIIIEKPNNKDK